MSAPARIITNPVTGEQLTWLVTSRQSGGRLAKAEIRVHGAIDRAGEISVLGPGESVAVAPGVEHSWWNARAGELCVHVEISPPGRYEELTELGFRWAREGHMSERAVRADGQKVAASGRIRAWRSSSWCSRNPTGWVPWASR
jgi:hypothetical protein